MGVSRISAIGPDRVVAASSGIIVCIQVTTASARRLAMGLGPVLWR